MSGRRIPQVIAIASISRDGTMVLTRDVRKRLGFREGKMLFLDATKEVLISTDVARGEAIEAIGGNRFRLTEEALSKLGVKGKALVALVERDGAVAVKRFEVAEAEGDRLRIVDRETTYAITRVVESNPMPEKLLVSLEKRIDEYDLRYDVKGFLKGRRSLEAWKARRLLRIKDASDEQLRRELAEERLAKQMPNGSWENKVTVTARNLRELADLGLTREDMAVKRAHQWLVNRPESEYNPGMFFVQDRLVDEQAEVVERRRKQKGGTRERFRKRLGSEMKLVKKGDDLIEDPCGPRIMWPNALVLEALLMLGYEDDDRVQRALQTLLTRPGWCECGYQHGLSDWRRREPFTMDEVAEVEKDCMERFKYGGVENLQDLSRRYETLGKARPRVSIEYTGEIDEYALGLPKHVQPCELITTRAMRIVKDPKMRRLAEASLWRFAARQNSEDGGFDVRCFSQAGYLTVFAGYEHPASRVAIMRSIPWIVKNQNSDGSWGEGSTKEASTLAVVAGLHNIGFL